MLNKALIKSCLMTIAMLILSFCIVPTVMAQSYSTPCPEEGVWDECFGTHEFENGDVYSGPWKDDYPDGVGEYRFVNGTIHQGFVKRGKIHGPGTSKTPDGVEISGNWIDDKLSGIVTGKDPKSGWIYKGIAKNGDLRKITYMEATGDKSLNKFGLIKVEGQNVEQGRVKAKYKNGDVYEGGFRNLLRHGTGKVLHSSGIYYEGGWRAGRKHGLGVSPLGNEIYEMRYENGVFVEKCADAPNICSDERLCSWATHKNLNRWTSNPKYSRHIRLAKSKGLTCGVVSCESDPKECSDWELCNVSTTKINGTTQWTSLPNLKEHVNQAQDRNLTCGVRMCAQDPSVCKDVDLCEMATFTTSNKRKWQDRSSKAHVAEAKKRRLNCGVDSCVTNPSKCTVSELCRRATTTYGPKSWSLRVSDKAYVQEAKRQKIACGVIGCDSNPSECDERQLCKKATFVSDNRNYWNTTRNLSYVNLAKLKGLTCNVSPSFGHGQVSKCNGSFAARCIGNREYSNAVYEGQFNAGQRDGPGYTSYDGGDTYVGNYASGNRSGPSLYVWKGGQAIFVDNWDDERTYTSNTDITRVFPYITNRFKTLELTDRKRLQASLLNKGFYNDDIDGIWGRNTLLALSKFSIFYLETPDLRRHENVEMLLDAVYAQATEEIVIPASEPTIAELRRSKSFASTQSRNLSLVESQYKSLGALNRKQVQWVLKRLGLYKSSIDGLWGPKTQQAMRDYLTSYGYYQAQHETIYSSVLSEMPVPTSFGSTQTRSSSSSSSSGGANLLKLLIVGGLCSATPDPSACLAGAASAVTGDEPPRASGPTYSGSTFSNRPTNTQCRTDFDCGINEQCISRLGKSICVKLVDNNGRKVYDRNAEPAECRNNTDCPSGFKCDRSMRICLKRW